MYNKLLLLLCFLFQIHCIQKDLKTLPIAAEDEGKVDVDLFSLFTVIFPYYGTVGEIGFIITGHDYKHGAVWGPLCCYIKAMLLETIFLATCLATMTTEKHCKLQRGCHTFAIFFRNLQRPLWKLFTTLSPPA